MFEILKSRNREEWLEMRKGGIGSSEAGTVAGLNPFESRYELWERKTGRIPPKVENEAMAQGHELEDVVAQMFERKTGKKVIRNSAGDWQFRNTEKPWMLASPDRTYWLGDKRNSRDWKQKGILECKTTMRSDITSGNIPPYWMAQVQWQLGIGEMDEAYIAWFCKWGCTMDYTDMPFNRVVFKTLEEIVDEFWLKNVKEDIEPVEMYASDVKRLFPVEQEGKTSVADLATVQLVARYKTLSVQAKAYDAELSEIKDKLIVAIGASEKLTTEDGVVLATYKAPKPTLKLDTKAFKEAEPETWQRFATEQQGERRLLIK